MRVLLKSSWGRAWGFGLVVHTLVLVAPAQAASESLADTLVVRSASGVFSPGLARSWHVESKRRVRLELLADSDVSEVAQTLRENLEGITVQEEDQALILLGWPLDKLLIRLASLVVSPDPLATLTGLEGAELAMGVPEGGGSIRASKPSSSLPPQVFSRHSARDRLVAEVVEVLPGNFPAVRLRLRARTTVQRGSLKGLVNKGDVFEASVSLAYKEGAIDFNHQPTQQNLGANYLRKGDRVTVHVVPGVERASLIVDYVRRLTR